MSTHLLEVTAETFDAEVLLSSTPVLVDFWAPWCAPCRVLTPQVERVAMETPSVKFVSVNAEAHPSLASEYGISGLPALLVFVAGQVVDRKHGAAGGYGAVKQLVAPHREAL